MAYYTHKRDSGDYQLLLDHLNGVARRAADFARPFSAERHARRTGLLHDVGKYSKAAQKRQLDPEHTSIVDHSTAGMQEAFIRLRDLHAAFVIAGHHGGLPNAGSAASFQDGTLMARVGKVLANEHDASAWKTELTVEAGSLLPDWLASVPPKTQGFANAMYTRMLFSCLVDADYLDTEAFMCHEKVQRRAEVTMPSLLKRLKEFVAPWLEGGTSEINRMRSRLLEQCLKGCDESRGLYSLTIPTGGGKTISSLAFALSHAVRHNLFRIIYVIPYTSIIEQNAQVFRNVLGNEAVLEHHSNADLDGEEETSFRLAAENWDAPVVVTTAVQFFESLFSSEPSRCRKLHNIADSVIIFDEAQMIPVPYLSPCANAIAELVQHYGVTAVLCTATQPALDGLFHSYAPELICKEIIPETEQFFRFFQRVRFVQEGCIAEEMLSFRLSACHQVLCIVNSRKRAKQLFEQLNPDGRFHLSTLMTPEHRCQTLATIRQRLVKGLACRVVSTSLIEAGVDVDFPSVWREETGLDSILQAAGRCNREGKRSREESAVHLFHFDETPPRMFAQNVYAMKKVMDEYVDIASPQAIKAYFYHLLFALGEQALDEKQILSQSERLLFEEIATSFRMVDQQTIPVYIPTEENRSELQLLREGGCSRAMLLRLGRSAVNVYPQHFQALRSVLDSPMGEQFGILMDSRQYDPECGLRLEPELGNLWFC